MLAATDSLVEHSAGMALNPPQPLLLDPEVPFSLSQASTPSQLEPIESSAVWPHARPPQLRKDFGEDGGRANFELARDQWYRRECSARLPQFDADTPAAQQREQIALARPPSPPSAFKPLPLAWPDAELPTVWPKAWPLFPHATPQTPPSLSPALPAMSEAPLPDGANEVHAPFPGVPPSQAAPLAPGVTLCTAITSLGERCRVTSEHSVIGAPLQHGGMLCREHMRRLPSSNPRPIPSSGRAIPKPTDRCKKCKQLGHWRAHCPNAWVAGPCALCGAIGHFAYACTKPR